MLHVQAAMHAKNKGLVKERITFLMSLSVTQQIIITSLQLFIFFILPQRDTIRTAAVAG